MTHISNSTALVAVALLLVGAVALPVGAVSEPRDRPAETRAPVEVYVSETLNISMVRLSGGERIGTDPITLRAVNGNERVTIEDPTNADFDGWTPGAYAAVNDSDTRADLRLTRPGVSTLTLRDERSIRVNGESVAPERLNRMTILAQYDFASVDRLDVTVTGPSGSEVATGRITESGGRITVDLGEPQPGTYRVTVAGSNVDAGTRTDTVRVKGVTATPTAEPTATSTATPTATTTATATATPTPEPTATATATSTATATPTTTTGDGTGFGVVAALLALVSLLAGLVRRR